MTFKVTDVCGLKRSRTNGGHKGVLFTSDGTVPQPSGERSRQTERRGGSGRNAEGRERRCGMKQIHFKTLRARVRLKSCDDSEGKKPSSVLLMRG